MYVYQKLVKIIIKKVKGQIQWLTKSCFLSVFYVSINLHVQLSVICITENTVHCIEKCVPIVCRGLTDESEILKFLQHGTLVGLLPVPHPILIRKYQANSGTAMWFRTYMWGVIYLRNVDPPIWYDTDVKLFEIQRV
uniref:HID1 domain-containing protein n=1 Tax=Micrurus lemniscatus lemniscatus TaxID=129467 RepID=A0A2D4JBA3_MICLE